ncbi:MAG: hypothetical protein ABS75_29995 [Pelagibacterium sp. SCN 63-23]|nr:MAG: hypothetical protein ABS75_29995 [Pelagibacterium sp. SCN 63-23]
MSAIRLVQIIFAFLLMALPALAQGITLNGTVTYYERIALPANAQLRVSLVALPGGAPIAGASATIPARGQVPLAFLLNLHRKPAGESYGLLAEIRSGGSLLFANVAPVPVSLAAGQPVAIVVQSMPRTPEPPIPPLPDIVDITWSVTSIGGRPANAPQPLTLSIAADLRASGHGGCNNYFAEATIIGKALSFGPAAATRMACAAELMTQESGFFAALAAVASFERDGDSLRLLDAAGIPLVGLVRVANE